MSNRKPRGDSKLDALTPEQQEQLCTWLTVDNLTYAAARKELQSRFGVSTTASALSSFYAQVAAPWKYLRAKGEADTFAQLMEGQFDGATIKRAKQLAFEAMTSPRPDLKAAKALLKIIGDTAKLHIAQEKVTLEQRKVAVLEKKAALADQAEASMRNPDLSPEERQAKLKEIFGLK